MNRSRWIAVGLTSALVVTGLVVALSVGAPDPGRTERIAAGALGGLALVVAIAVASTPSSDGHHVAQDRRAPDGSEERPDAGSVALVELERGVRFAATAMGDYHVTVRPRLVGLASRRLEHLQVSLDDRPRATALLGEDLYRLVDPSVTIPTDRYAPGVPVSTVTALLDRLEEIERSGPGS